MRQISLDSRYLVNIGGTSDGTQDKYYKNGIWYKVDHWGNEGLNEHIASCVLACTSISKEHYVQYKQIKINGQSGCFSKSFLTPNEEYISIYRLHQSIVGSDIGTLFMKMDFDDQKEYLQRFVKRETGLDLSQTLGELFFIDNLILNEDRHFNNIGVIYNGQQFLPAPIFDNGKSFFCGNKKYNAKKPLSENIKNTRIQPFIAFRSQLLKSYPINVTFDWRKVRLLLQSLKLQTLHQEILFNQLQPYMEKQLQENNILREQYKAEVFSNSQCKQKFIQIEQENEMIMAIKQRLF